MELKTTKVFKELLQSWVGGKRRHLMEGGTSSSKTWTALQFLIIAAQEARDPLLISVVSESLPHLKRGCIRDYFNILAESPDNNSCWSKTEFTYRRPEWKGVIEFFGADNADKVRGPRRDILFINEGNNIPWETAQGLDIRTSRFTVVDWNPVSEFWAHAYWLTNPDTGYSHSTYLDAKSVLPTQVVTDIESYKDKDPNWWNVYGLGLVGRIEGLVYPHFEQVDELPLGSCFYGLDFGFSCLTGDTLIATDKGNKEIRNVRKGDRVLTRKGYRQVIWGGSRGVKQVYELDFGHKKRIIVTGDHLIYTATGWQRADRLKKEETICGLKSNTTVKSFAGTLTANTLITFITNMVGSASPLSFIGKYGKTILGKSPRMALSIIGTATHLITTLKTLCWLPIASIKQFITQINLAQYPLKNYAVSAQNTDIQLPTGRNVVERVWILQESALGIALSAVKKSSRQIPINDSVALSVGNERTQRQAKKNIPARIAGRCFQPLPISQEIPAPQNVRIRSRLLKEKCEVFDLTIDGEHEFFANGILVHNCDPSVLVKNVLIGDKLYSKQMFYDNSALTNDQIAQRLSLLGIKNEPIYPDPDEPKSAEELRQLGFNICEAVKGKGSVEFGIQKVNNYYQHWTKDSLECIKEQRNYRYIKDKQTGGFTDRTTHQWSHGMDARRYAVATYLPTFMTTATTRRSNWRF